MSRRATALIMLVCALALAACGKNEKAGEADTSSKPADAVEVMEVGSNSRADTPGPDLVDTDGQGPDVCVPQCNSGEKECGYDDRCGGICGCPDGLECVDTELDEDGLFWCLPPCELACENPQAMLGWPEDLGPACGTLELVMPTVSCECGECDDGNPCTDDECVANPDVLGGSCSFTPNDMNACDDGDPTTVDLCKGGVCMPCEPDCQGKECGDDGCGGSCGGCGEPMMECVEGQCELVCDCLEDEDCQPAEDFDLCNGKLVCGLTTPCMCELEPDSVVECPDGHVCILETGECCSPACEGKECGDDGCGGSCGGPCPCNFECVDGQCAELCEPECQDKQCGDGGCGCPDLCGTCPDGQACNEWGQCE